MCVKILVFSRESRIKFVEPKFEGNGHMHKIILLYTIAIVGTPWINQIQVKCYCKSDLCNAANWDHGKFQTILIISLLSVFVSRSDVAPSNL